MKNYFATYNALRASGKSFEETYTELQKTKVSKVSGSSEELSKFLLPVINQQLLQLVTR